MQKRLVAKKFNMVSSSSLGCHLDLIEMHLKYGRPVNSEDDVQFIEYIIKSFHTLWKLLKQYPELASEFDTDQFRSIYNDMSSDFGHRCTDSELQPSMKYISETANHPTVPIKRVDDSVQKSGNQSQNIICVDNEFISGVSRLTISRGDDVNDKQLYRTGKICDDGHMPTLDQWIFTHGSGKYACNLCKVWSLSLNGLREHVEGQEHQKILSTSEKTPYVVSQDRKLPSVSQCGQRYDHSCTTKPLHRPLEEKTTELESIKERKSAAMKVKKRFYKLHRRKTKLKIGPSLFPEPKNENMISNVKQVSPEIQKIYHSNPTLRLSYFFHKICIFRSAAYPNYYTCGLCNIDTMNEEKSYEHILENAHKSRVTKVISKCDVKSVSFEVVILPGNNLRNCRKCFLCNVRLPENDPHNYDIHLQTLDHQKRAKAHFKSRRFQDWERGIILKNGEPYCIFCYLYLPSDSAMYQHVTDPTHMQNSK